MRGELRKDKDDRCRKLHGRLPSKLAWGLLVILLALCLVACGPGENADASSSLEDNVARTYVGRDCIFYRGQLYWNNGLWFSAEDGSQNLLPTDHYEEGQVSQCVGAIPQTEGEAAVLPEGTSFLYHEETDAIFVRKETGYIQYIPMMGMEEAVEELIAIDPTGIEPGYEYMGVPLIFYEGQLYKTSAVFYEPEQVGALRQLGRIQCRCDAVPTEHLHSSSLDAGTIVYQAANYPEDLVINRSASSTYQLYCVYESAE